eukprot:COSAG01_NODE_41892_length_445_cov_68.245665_1_plen_43_part_10
MRGWGARFRPHILTGTPSSGSIVHSEYVLTEGAALTLVIVPAE